MVNYYLDTSIWLDYYEKRERNGEIAIKFIKKILNDNNIILYSDIHIKEFKGLGFNKNEIFGMLKIAKPNIKLVHMNKEQCGEGKNLIKHFQIPLNDALHAIIARDNEAILISRDKHFLMLKFVISVNKPEEFI